jgi:hypothetical protein
MRRHDELGGRKVFLEELAELMAAIAIVDYL